MLYEFFELEQLRKFLTIMASSGAYGGEIYTEFLAFLIDVDNGLIKFHKAIVYKSNIFRSIKAPSGGILLITPSLSKYRNFFVLWNQAYPLCVI